MGLGRPRGRTATCAGGREHGRRPRNPPKPAGFRHNADKIPASASLNQNENRRSRNDCRRSGNGKCRRSDHYRKTMMGIGALVAAGIVALSWSANRIRLAGTMSPQLRLSRPPQESGSAMAQAGAAPRRRPSRPARRPGTQRCPDDMLGIAARQGGVERCGTGRPPPTAPHPLDGIWDVESPGNPKVDALTILMHSNYGILHRGDPNKPSPAAGAWRLAGEGGYRRDGFAVGLSVAEDGTVSTSLGQFAFCNWRHRGLAGQAHRRPGRDDRRMALPATKPAEPPSGAAVRPSRKSTTCASGADGMPRRPAPGCPTISAMARGRAGWSDGIRSAAAAAAPPAIAASSCTSRCMASISSAPMMYGSIPHRASKSMRPSGSAPMARPNTAPGTNAAWATCLAKTISGIQIRLGSPGRDHLAAGPPLG